MRIAYLTQSYPPMISGAAIVVEGLAKAMAKRGHQVLVIAASDKNHPCVSYQENLTIMRLRSIHNPLRVGQRFLLFPRGSVMKTLQEFNPEIIHLHEPLLIGWLGIRYAKQSNIPTTLTVHQVPSFVACYFPNFFRAHVETVLWMYARWLSKKFTSIVVPTQTVSTLITQMTGLHANTISYGIDLEIFRPALSLDEEVAARQKWNLPSNVPILLHVGRLDIEKRVERVIQAAAKVLNQTNAHLVIVGDGSQKNNLVKLCNDIGITERVHFTGFVSAQEGLPEIYRLANLFVTASEIETQGIVLLEAAASGLPIVAVRATCIPEIVHNGINGHLTEPGATSALASAMSRLLKNPSKAKFMGKASRTLAEKHEICLGLDEHEQLYRQLVRKVRIQRVKAKTSF